VIQLHCERTRSISKKTGQNGRCKPGLLRITITCQACLPIIPCMA
jgi:hypothetical protein